MLNLIAPDPSNGIILLLLAESGILIVFVKRLLDILRFILFLCSLCSLPSRCSKSLSLAGIMFPTNQEH
jgi:hypothetical protein